jgi:hypothetical protein
MIKCATVFQFEIHIFAKYVLCDILIRQCTDVGSGEHPRDLPHTCPGFIPKKINIEEKYILRFLNKRFKLENGNIIILTTKTENIFTCMADYRRGFGSNIDHLNIQLVITLNYTAIAQFE